MDQMREETGALMRRAIRYLDNSIVGAVRFAFERGAGVRSIIPGADGIDSISGMMPVDRYVIFFVGDTGITAIIWLVSRGIPIRVGKLASVSPDKHALFRLVSQTNPEWLERATTG